jgi:hypothetical protein
MSRVAHGMQLFQRPDRAAAVVMGLLDADETGRRAVRAEAIDRGFQLLDREDAAVAVDRFGR